MPGSLNCKDEANPTKVTIHAQSNCRYIPSDMIQYLNDLAVPNPGTETPAESESAERAESAPLTINLSARVPEERLKTWLDADQRFKNTWLRQRTDFQDQAQERYDLALASFAFGAGCSEQEVVDLIIHHRFLHGQRQRTKVDYFERTLSKADKSSSSKFLSGGTMTPAATSPPIEPGASTLNAERVRIGLCREISEALGVEVLRVMKLTGQVPSYRLELAQGKIEFPNVSKLINQNAVRDGIAGMTGFLMPRFKPKEWPGVAQKLLSACIEEQGSDELFTEGAARLYISHYLHDAKLIPSFDGQPRHNLLKPMVRHGHITLSSIDFQFHLAKVMMQSFSLQKLAGMLSAIGAKAKRVHCNKHDQSRWELPLEEFNPADYLDQESEDPA